MTQLERSDSPSDLESNAATEAAASNHFHSFAYAPRKFTGGDVTDKYSKTDSPVFSNP